MVGKRELYLTDEEEQVSLGDIVSACHVLHPDAVEDLRLWLSRSPNHFYARYHFPSLNPRSWKEREAISPHPGGIEQCQDCSSDRTAKLDLEDIFDISKRRPLRTFDPFAGVGAFGRGLEEAGSINVTHSVEISPSASETLRYVMQLLCIWVFSDVVNPV